MVSIGSASFELIGDDSQLTAAFVQAQAKAQQASQAIQAVVKAQTAAIQAGSTAQAGALQQVAAQQALVAQSAAQMAAQAQQRYAEMAKAAEGAKSGFSDLAKEGLGLVTAFAGVALGAEGVRKAFDAVIDSTLKAQQASRTLNAAYGESAGSFKTFADDLAASLGKTNAEVETGVARMAVLQKQYGITSGEIEKLTKISYDLAAAFGDSDEAIRSVQAAIRGEPEALEKYGIALQQNAIQNNDLLTESEKKNFQNLDAVTQARIRYRIILAESAQYEGAAAQRSEELAGQLDKAHRATDELSKTIGASLLPGLSALAEAWTAAANATNEYIKKAQEANTQAEQAGIFGTLRGAAFGTIGTAPAPVKTPAQGTGPLLGPSPADVKAANAQIEAETRRSEDQQVADIIDGLKEIKKAREAALAEQKQILERELQNKLKALDDEKTAQLKSIHDQAEAAAEASRATIAQLHEDEQAKKDIVTQEKQDTLDGIAAAKDAADDAAAEQIRLLQVRQHDEEEYANEHYKDVISDLDREKRLRDDARTQEDRRLQDSIEATKRTEDARHLVITRELDTEVKAANDAKDKKLRALAEETKADADKHTKKLQQLQDEADQDRRIHDATLATIEGEAKAAQLAHDATEKTLQTELDSAAKAHDASEARIQAEADAASTAHDARLRALSDEADAAQTNHDTIVRAIEVEVQAAQDKHDRIVRGIEQEASAEDDRHRLALAAIDSETRARQDALDAQIRGLDNLDKAQANASTIQGLQDRVATAQSGVKRAESTGNQSTIDEANRVLLAAQQALADGQTKILRDAERQQLQDQKQAISDTATAQKAAEDETDRKIKATLDLRKQAADDALTQVKRVADASKQAADDELKRIQTRVSAETQAENDQYARIQLRLKQEKDSADAALKLVQERVAAGKLANDALLASTKDRLDKEKALADETLKIALDKIDKEKKAEDDKYKLLQDRLDKRKIAIDDATKSELDGIAKRKLAEQDLHDRNVTLAQDQATAKKRAVDDVRTKENQADTDARKQADFARDESIARTKAVYTDPISGLIPHIQRAKEAADLSFDGQKQAAERAATASTKAIDTLYNDPIKGLIPLAQAAERANALSYQHQAADVQASIEAQRVAVQKAYRADDGKSGIIDQIDEAKHQLDVQLEAEEKRWKDYKEGLTGKQGTITQTWEEALKKAKEYFDEVDRRRRGINSEGGSSGGGYGPSPSEVPTGIGSGIGPGPGGIPGVGATPGGPGGSSGGSGGSGASPAIGAPEHPNTSPLFQRLLTAAMPVAAQYDLPAYIMAAIPIQEGISSQLQTQYHNLFSIKGTGPAGSVTLPSDEIENGHRVSRMSAFRVYHNEAESYADFGKLMATSGIYDKGVAIWHATHDAKKFADAIAPIYATDPTWGSKIASIAGYANGGLITDPHLMMNQRTGAMSQMAENGPEWIVPTYGNAGSALNISPSSYSPYSGGSTAGAGMPSGGSPQTMHLTFQIGGRVVEDVWIDGYQMNARRGRLPSTFGSLTG